MGDRETTPFPRIWAICAGMPCGPIEIPAEHRRDDVSAISYTLKLMEDYIRGRAGIQWDSEGKKQASQFYRDERGKPYLLVK